MHQNAFLQDDDSLSLNDLLDSSIFDQTWARDRDLPPLKPSDAPFDLEFDSQQDLLESRRLTALLDSNQHLFPLNEHVPQTSPAVDTRLYGLSHDFTQSSPALVSTALKPNKYRSLPRRKSRYGLYQAGGRAVSIPQPLRQLEERRERADLFATPLERWQNSPPDNDLAPISAIHQEHERRLLDPAFVQNTELSPPAVWTGYRTSSRANSTTGSEASELSVTSNTSEKSSASQRARKLSQRRKSRNQKQKGVSEVAGERPFKCTFCCDDFKHKYDWARHEKSLHLNIGGWRCAPLGPAVVSESSDRLVCAFCNILDPNTDHIETHNYQACLRTIGRSHIFQRKDHLTQHLRLVHHLEAIPIIDDWKVQVPSIRSRCGMCGIVMQSWDERTEHLAAHFRSGLTMDNWNGDHGLEDSISSQVTNSLPPWLLKYESKSIIPFSATNSASRDQYRQHVVNAVKLGNSISATQPDNNDAGALTDYANVVSHQPDGKVSFELLTSHLGRFAREQMAQGIVPTDAMFQKEARKLFYGDDDEWNQTVADDSAWLSAFRLQNQCNIGPDS